MGVAAVCAVVMQSAQQARRKALVQKSMPDAVQARSQFQLPPEASPPQPHCQRAKVRAEMREAKQGAVPVPMDGNAALPVKLRKAVN